MPRHPKKAHASPKHQLVCPVVGCQKICRSRSGLTRHLQLKHDDYSMPKYDTLLLLGDVLFSQSSSPLPPSPYSGHLGLSSPPPVITDHFSNLENFPDLNDFTFNGFSEPEVLQSPQSSPEVQVPTPTVEYHPILTGKSSFMSFDAVLNTFR